MIDLDKECDETARTLHLDALMTLKWLEGEKVGWRRVLLLRNLSAVVNDYLKAVTGSNECNFLIHTKSEHIDVIVNKYNEKYPTRGKKTELLRSIMKYSDDNGMVTAKQVATFYSILNDMCIALGYMPDGEVIKDLVWVIK